MLDSQTGSLGPHIARQNTATLRDVFLQDDRFRQFAMVKTKMLHWKIQNLCSHVVVFAGLKHLRVNYPSFHQGEWKRCRYFLPLPVTRTNVETSCWPAEIVDGPLKTPVYQYPPVKPSLLCKTQKVACSPASPALGITRGLWPWQSLLPDAWGSKHIMSRATKEKGGIAE